MSEFDRYSSFRISREVVVTPAVKRVHDSLQAIVARTFNAQGTGLDIRPVESLIHEGEPPAGRYDYTSTEVPSAKIYALNSWSYTHLEILVPPDQHKLELQRRRLYGRSAELIAKVAASDEELLVNAVQVTTEFQTDYPSLGEELVLKLHPKRENAVMIDEQNSLLHEVIRSSGPGSQLVGAYMPRPLTISIGRLPLESTVCDESYELRRRKLLVAAGLHMPLSKIVLCPATPSARDAPATRYLRLR